MIDLSTSIKLAKDARISILNMIHNSHASHIASAFSVVDILAVLYSYIANINKNNIYDDCRDKIVLSKGHAGSALYAILGELDFFDKTKLNTYYQNGSIFSGHVSHKVPGVEISTGSLGQGVCMACGMALADKILKKTDCRTFAIIGDGESEEGTVWEMAAFASKQKLNNFTVIVDFNRMQAMGNTEAICDFEFFTKKWEAFGWNCHFVQDGNDHLQLYNAFLNTSKTKPTVIIANTVKGKGVSFMENNLLWHYRDPQNEFYDLAMKELNYIKA